MSASTEASNICLPARKMCSRELLRQSGNAVHTSSPQVMSLIVPVAAWPVAPAHDIVQVLATPCERAAVVTASATGQLCIWGVDTDADTDAPGGALLPR